MLLQEALEALNDGKKIWHEKIDTAYWCRENGCLWDAKGASVKLEIRFMLNTMLTGWRIYTEPNLNFEWALAEIRKGKKVRRRVWHADCYICKIKDVSKPSVYLHDLLNNDWELYDA